MYALFTDALQTLKLRMHTYYKSFILRIYEKTVWENLFKMVTCWQQQFAASIQQQKLRLKRSIHKIWISMTGVVVILTFS